MVVTLFIILTLLPVYTFECRFLLRACLYECKYVCAFMDGCVHVQMDRWVNGHMDLMFVLEYTNKKERLVGDKNDMSRQLA